MPHIIVEHSDNVSADVQQTEVVRALHETVIESGLFSPQAVKARRAEYTDYVLTNGIGSFVHITVAILDTRTEAQRNALADSVYARAKSLLPHVDALSVDIREMCKETYRK